MNALEARERRLIGGNDGVLQGDLAFKPRDLSLQGQDLIFSGD